MKEQFDLILDVYSRIKLDRVTLLTGGNSTGKSLIAREIGAESKDEYGIGPFTASMSMRTSSFPSLGAMSGLFRDLPWLPTAMQTISSIKKAVNACKEAGRGYVVIDEPGIGCSDEVKMAIGQWINELVACASGVLIVTHSREIALAVEHDEFFNLDGYETLEQWVNREIEPADLDEVLRNKMFMYIRDNK